MSVILNEVRRATYLNSIVLMRISRQIALLPGIEEAGLIIGTPANKEILRDAGILGPEGTTAEPSDLILALRATDARRRRGCARGGKAAARSAEFAGNDGRRRVVAHHSRRRPDGCPPPIWR